MSGADEATLDEIKRLSGALLAAQSQPYSRATHTPSYKPYYPGRGRSGYLPYGKSTSKPHTEIKQVQLGGETFKSSKYKLTRQTSLTTATTGPPPPQKPVSSGYHKIAGHPYAYTHPSTRRPFKPKRGRPSRNLTLVLNKPVRTTRKAKPKSDKQCPFFSRTGTCGRGKDCPYQHDPEKIAICPQYMANNCPNTVGTCILSHQSTLHRVPPCLHFSKTGMCKNGDACKYPHVRLGARSGVCRDFAVLGYCEKGGDCDKEHVRECPDFAETGVCEKKACKLPHVIRANRQQGLVNARSAPVAVVAGGSPVGKTPAKGEEVLVAAGEPKVLAPPAPPVDGVNYSFAAGDEFIPLTFLESDEDGAEDDAEDDTDEGGEGDGGEEGEEGSEEDGDDLLVIG